MTEATLQSMVIHWREIKACVRHLGLRKKAIFRDVRDVLDENRHTIHIRPMPQEEARIKEKGYRLIGYVYGV